MSWSNYSGSSGSTDRNGIWTSRGDMARRSTAVGGQGAGTRGSGPQYWSGGYTANGERPQHLTAGSNYRTLEPIYEEMTSPPRAYLNGAATAVSPNGYNSRQNTPTLNGNNRRHSEGDLLEMSSGGPRFNKKPPGSASRQLARQGSGEGRSPRKKSSDATRDIDAFSDVSGKSRISVGSEDSITSASQLANRRRSEPSMNPMRKTSSTASLVSGEQRRKSSAGAASVASTERRSSVANGLDAQQQPAQDRRLSVLTIGGGGAGSSPFTNIEIPMDFLDSTRSRLRKLMTPIILLVVVTVIVVSLSVAIYFAVALKGERRAWTVATVGIHPETGYEFLRAALHLSITRDKYSRDLERMMKDGSMDDLKTSCCKQVDELYTGSILWNDFRGCEVETLQQTKIHFSLYFLNKTAIYEDTVVGVLVPTPTSSYQIVDINGFELNVSNSARDVNLEVVRKPENYYGVHSPELKPKAAVNDIVVNKTTPETLGVTQPLIKALTFALTSPTTTTTASTPSTVAATTQVTQTTTTTPSTTLIYAGTSTPSVIQDTAQRGAVQETALTTASTITPTVTTTATTTTTTTSQTPTTATAGTAAAAKISLTTSTPAPKSTVTLSIQVLNKLCQDDPQAGILSHPVSCTDFIQCEFEQAKTRPCPPGLIFNATLSQCVLPEPDSPCAPKPCDNLNGGYYANPMNCTQYIMCEFNKAVVKSCTETMVWDEIIKNCVPLNVSHQCSTLPNTDCSICDMLHPSYFGSCGIPRVSQLRRVTTQWDYGP
ncbi:hypothetical protein Btru_023488 [Bulinus truncatus]|nr:hypothetical protein Btru_023488 [Bulinus truncatus]